MPHITFRVSEEEKSWIESYAQLHGLSLSDAVKRAFFEKLEEEYDLKAYETAMEEYHKNPKTYTLEEVERELGIRS